MRLRGLVPAWGMPHRTSALIVVVNVVVLAGAAFAVARGQGRASEDVGRTVAVALVLGLVLGLAFAVLRAMRRRRKRTPQTLEERFRTPVLGAVPSSDRLSRTPRDPAAARAVYDEVTGAVFNEIGRGLAARLAGTPRVIAITSPESRDGRSTVAMQLAVAAAFAGQRVVLVDADLNRPTVATRLGMEAGAGLVDLLDGRVDVADVVRPSPVHDGLFVLAAGSRAPHPPSLLASEPMRALLAGLARNALVVVDAPPVLPATTVPMSTGAAELTLAADGALVVVSASDTHDRELREAMRQLTAAGGRVLGFVVNRTGRPAPVDRPVS